MPVILDNKNLTINDKVYQNKGVLSIYSDENNSKFNKYKQCFPDDIFHPKIFFDFQGKYFDPV